MPNVFFTADTHFGHRGIISHCNRPFKTDEEMDGAIIDNWNKQVRPDDHVWHLGDFAWRNHVSYLRRLNGRLHLVLGNHDKMAAYARAEFAAIYELYDGRVTGNPTDPRFFLFHYPMVSWPKKGYGTIHLHGHTHGGYDRAGDPSIDVGMDCRNFTLFPLDEVVSFVAEKVKTSGHNPCLAIKQQKDKVDAK